MSPRENAAEIQQKSGFSRAWRLPCWWRDRREEGRRAGERDRRRNSEGREGGQSGRAGGGRAKELGAGRGGSEGE